MCNQEQIDYMISTGIIDTKKLQEYREEKVAFYKALWYYVITFFKG